MRTDPAIGSTSTVNPSPAESPGRRVVLDADSGHLRRVLGPTAWVVLEELILRSSGTDERSEAQVSVRALAASLGLAKDTVGRALQRLRAAGLVASCEQRRERAGTFDAGTYVIDLPLGITLADVATTQTTPLVRPSRTRSADASQLALAIES
jgi:DNA-binding transcriptional ArsR family regulator